MWTGDLVVHPPLLEVAKFCLPIYFILGNTDWVDGS